MSEATHKTLNKKQLEEHNIKKHKINCNKCDFTARVRVQLNMHKEAHHTNKTLSCQKCDFVAKSEIQLNKHMAVRHGPTKEVCWFWQNGRCAKPTCRYQHPVFERKSTLKHLVPCRYGDFCHNNYCGFDHSKTFLGRRPTNWRLN